MLEHSALQPTTARGTSRRRTASKRVNLRPCGTRAAYQRHLLRGEVTDALCCDAEAAYQRERREARALAQAVAA